MRIDISHYHGAENRQQLKNFHVAGSHIPIIPAVSMGRRNTHLKSYPQVFQRLN